MTQRDEDESAYEMWQALFKEELAQQALKEKQRLKRDLEDSDDPSNEEDEDE